jgi:hypothetical protein
MQVLKVSLPIDFNALHIFLFYFPIDFCTYICFKPFQVLNVRYLPSDCPVENIAHLDEFNARFPGGSICFQFGCCYDIQLFPKATTEVQYCVCVCCSSKSNMVSKSCWIHMQHSSVYILNNLSTPKKQSMSVALDWKCTIRTRKKKIKFWRWRLW